MRCTLLQMLSQQWPHFPMLCAGSWSPKPPGLGRRRQWLRTRRSRRSTSITALHSSYPLRTLSTTQCLCQFCVDWVLLLRTKAELQTTSGASSSPGCLVSSTENLLLIVPCFPCHSERKRPCGRGRGGLSASELSVCSLGGLDYAFLVLKAEGYVTKLQEKRWNRWLQQWLRGPAMSIYAFIAFTAYRTGNTAHLPAPIVLLVASLHFVNGIYYADEAVGSWYTWKERMDGANKSK